MDLFCKWLWSCRNVNSLIPHERWILVFIGNSLKGNEGKDVDDPRLLVIIYGDRRNDPTSHAGDLKETDPKCGWEFQYLPTPHASAQGSAWSGKTCVRPRR